MMMMGMIRYVNGDDSVSMSTYSRANAKSQAKVNARLLLRTVTVQLSNFFYYQRKFESLKQSMDAKSRDGRLGNIILG
jgi:hypothetical protein